MSSVALHVVESKFRCGFDSFHAISSTWHLPARLADLGGPSPTLHNAAPWWSRSCAHAVSHAVRTALREKRAKSCRLLRSKLLCLRLHAVSNPIGPPFVFWGLPPIDPHLSFHNPFQNFTGSSPWRGPFP